MSDKIVVEISYEEWTEWPPEKKDQLRSLLKSNYGYEINFIDSEEE